LRPRADYCHDFHRILFPNQILMNPDIELLDPLAKIHHSPD
jgi:hypothetical protein